jgi:hypothetical protein
VGVFVTPLRLPRNPPTTPHAIRTTALTECGGYRGLGSVRVIPRALHARPSISALFTADGVYEAAPAPTKGRDWIESNPALCSSERRRKRSLIRGQREGREMCGSAFYRLTWGHSSCN